MGVDCSICSAPVQVLKAINEGLAKRTKMRDLAKQSGFSKSAIGRHSKNCLARQILSSYQTTRFNPALGRIFVRWPDDPICPEDVRGRFLPAHRIPGEHDVVIYVVYEKPVYYRVENIDAAHNLAIEENQSRNPVPIDQDTPVN
jgi:hypothetical protein